MAADQRTIMQHTVCEAHVRMAALRVEALRGLIRLMPAGVDGDLIQSQLADAEKLLRHRWTAYSACLLCDRPDRCTLFDAPPFDAALTEAPQLDRRRA